MTRTLALIGHGDTTRAYGSATGGTLDARMYALASNASQGMAHYFDTYVAPEHITLGHLRMLAEVTER